MRLADYVIQFLEKKKIDTVFTVSGGGSICDKNGRSELSYGDIVKTDDFRILSKVFKI